MIKYNSNFFRYLFKSMTKEKEREMYKKKKDDKRWQDLLFSLSPRFSFLLLFHKIEFLIFSSSNILVYIEREIWNLYTHKKSWVYSYKVQMTCLMKQLWDGIRNWEIRTKKWIYW